MAGDARRTGIYFTHSSSLEHDPRVLMPAHPDTPERMFALERMLAAEGRLGWERRAAPAADERTLELVHSARLVREIEQLALSGGGAVDADTVVGEPSFRAALHAVGGACELVRALLAGEAELGFSALRPSGHHAEPDRAMGFCLFDNIAVAAALAIAELGAERVFVLDWDVHHGNGTAEAFRTRADVLFASIHQSPLYPGTGPLGDVGSGAGEGYTLNLPVSPGSGEETWLSLLEHVVIPVARAFAPDLVLVSAGFDAHRADPLADCRLETSSFGELARHVRDLASACDVPVGLVLEGGYEPVALARSVRETLLALGDERPPPSASGELLETRRAVAQLSPFWAL
ncbi:MAG TPA: histone deacetylase [Solirubrobacteraceae bacterium]|jgi:acetoin utilization deacetylase AcuC-like enzyme|nr:histone deacetylase [Solirubrobacteraceae bacterium]